MLYSIVIRYNIIVPYNAILYRPSRPRNRYNTKHGTIQYNTKCQVELYRSLRGDALVFSFSPSLSLCPQDFNTRYWSGRYVMRAGHLIASLAGRQDKILTTGKYLNVVR